MAEHDPTALIAAMLDDASAAWSLGGFGAAAEFRRGADEAAAPLDGDRLGRVTPRGAIAIDPEGVVPVAYETAFFGGWSHAVALCLPAGLCVMARRAGVAELGPDAGAARPTDRGAILFDLGLGLPQAEICLRACDQEALRLLRSAGGLSLADPAHPIRRDLSALPVDWVAAAPLGRIEVFHEPPREDGPRMMAAPSILRAGRTHAATAPIPAGLVPCAHLHPAHPNRDAAGRPIPFRRDRHAAFQALYASWGDPGHVALKRRIAAGAPVDESLDRRARMVVKVARAQAEASARGGA